VMAPEGLLGWIHRRFERVAARKEAAPIRTADEPEAKPKPHTVEATP